MGGEKHRGSGLTMPDQTIEQRLDTIESLLRQVLQQQPVLHSILPQTTVDLKTEIAQVKAGDGDLVTHFKNKAKHQMQEQKK